MADRVRIAVSAVPIETITDENAQSHDILASEINTTLSGQGNASVSNYGGDLADQGYKDDTVNYHECIDSSDTDNFTEINEARIVLNDTVTVDVTTLVQQWTAKNSLFPNNGFLLQSINESQTLARTAFNESACDE